MNICEYSYCTFAISSIICSFLNLEYFSYIDSNLKNIFIQMIKNLNISIDLHELCRCIQFMYDDTKYMIEEEDRKNKIEQNLS